MKKLIQKLKKRHWTAILFVGIVHLTGLIAWPIYVYFDGVPQWQEISVFVFMYILAILGINFGYHRALSHKSFKMSPVLKFLALFGGASAGENSALNWCSDHRRHHRYEDTDRDPYNINQGFWWAHMGWIFNSPPSNDYSNCPDLTKDPLMQHQNKYYGLWLAIAGFGLPLALGFLLQRPLATLLLAGFTRLMLVNQITYLVNSWAHYFGTRPYSKDVTARDSMLVAFLASGEGYHNFHHRFPFDFRNGHRWYHWDPVKWMVYVAQFAGMATNLKRTPATEIYRARIQAQTDHMGALSPRLAEMKEMLETSLVKWRNLQYEFQQVRSSIDREGRQQLQLLRSRMNEARQEFKERYEEWRDLYSMHLAQSA